MTFQTSLGGFCNYKQIQTNISLAHTIETTTKHTFQVCTDLLWKNEGFGKHVITVSKKEEVL